VKPQKHSELPASQTTVLGNLIWLYHLGAFGQPSQSKSKHAPQYPPGFLMQLSSLYLTRPTQTNPLFQPLSWFTLRVQGSRSDAT